MTAQEVLLGFALALVLGFAFAIVLHLSDTLRRAFYPLLVASQTVPVIAIAPILIVWLGFGIGPKLAIIALVCFFPITVNTLDGLRSVDPDLPRMMRTLDAGRAQILRRVEIPSALPYLVSGAKIAAAISVIGAVFGEWAGADEGLGHLILIAQGQLQTARVFAAVVVLSALALILFGTLALLERRFGWWTPRRIGEGGGMRRAGCSHWRVFARRAGRERLRREAGEPRRRRRAAHPDARLLRQPRPRRDLHGARPRLLRRGGPRGRAAGAVRSRRRRSARSPPGAPTSRSPTSPRSCSPRRRACRWSRSPRWCPGR